MSPLEKEAKCVFEMVIDGLSHPTTPTKFMMLMGSMRDMVRKLENKEFGCHSGLHRGKCTCKPGIPGKAIWDKPKGRRYGL